MQANKKVKKRKAWPWVLTSVVVLVVAATFFLNPMRRFTTTAFQSYTVSRGNVESTITGSGTLQANDVENMETNSYRLALAEQNQVAEQLQAVLLYINNPQVIAKADGLVSEVLISDNTETGSGSSTDTSAPSSSGGAMGGNAGASAQSTASTGTTGSGFSPAFTIHTGGAVKMFINVDELDINAVALEQEVTVTLDAFAGESYTAKVAHISKLGTASGNITTYPVELSLEYNERFLEGMNGSAVIITERAENVLFIPIAAIYEDSTGTYVYIVSGETQTRADITTGISDGVNAEVMSGLSENDVIQYVDTSSSSTWATGGFGGGGPFGGGGGGNPFGGGGQ